MGPRDLAGLKLHRGRTELRTQDSLSQSIMLRVGAAGSHPYPVFYNHGSFCALIMLQVTEESED